MRRKEMLSGVVLSMLFFLLMTGVCIAQGQTNAQNLPGKQEMETIKGTINFNERMGGFFIKGIEPGGEYFIVNQDAKILKKLKKSGKAVVIEGHVGEGGAEYFVIEKINGKKYPAAKTTSKMPTAK